MPKVEVYILPSDAAPAPAVANAVARLGGPRARRLPFARAGLVAV